MIIKINGQDTEINTSATLLDIINERGLKSEHIVVEHNQQIIPKDKLGAIAVAQKDSIEIVSFVGGG